jgi:heme exporter protein CcmD
MQHLHGYFVAAAYAIFAVVLAADFLLPRLRQRQVLRGIRLRERRQSPKAPE